MGTRTIDWEEIHRRLEVASAAAGGGYSDDPEEVRRVLTARARKAARPPATPDESRRLEVLSFSLAMETYAVETRHVREVLQLKHLTALPGTPPFIAGVTNVRGRILAIVDLRVLFELPARGLTELNRIIVLSGGGDELGLLADSIDGVRSVPVADLQDGLPTLGGIRERFLVGITNKMTAVLDGGLLLADASLKVNEQTAR